MTADVVRDVVAGALLLGGALLAFGAGVGIVRFGDLLSRMHSATKPQVLGLVLVLLGLAVRLGGVPVVWMLLLVVMFQLLTSPVAAHMVARAGYRTGKVQPELLEVDELTRDLRAAERELAERGDEVSAGTAELRDDELPDDEPPDDQLPYDEPDDGRGPVRPG